MSVYCIKLSRECDGGWPAAERMRVQVLNFEPNNWFIEFYF